MDWLVLSPFVKTTYPGWLMPFIDPARHRTRQVPADYDHDRSRAVSSGRQWLDYLRQQKFSYSREGIISDANATADKTSPANQTILKLHLTGNALDTLRRDAIDATLEPQQGKRLSLVQAEKRLHELEGQTPDNGLLDEFCFVLKQHLKAYISLLKQIQSSSTAKSKSRRTK
ncbi:MAG: hypothetical protein EOO81_06560 [Oxalobacteraceae bacterium]|nr:MAG: hypothetical protein EOO81_06560 [Oxalobacteraceae bacterium]